MIPSGYSMVTLAAHPPVSEKPAVAGTETGLSGLAPAPRPAIIVESVKQNDFASFKEIEGLQRKIWNYSDLDITPTFTFQILANGSGQLMIAREGVKAVGFAFTFLKQDSTTGKFSFYLDLVGVDPAYQDRGIGMQLLEALKQDALNRNIDSIEWLYDGLETRNAKLYLAKIGARVVGFEPNYYGIHQDLQSDGLPTDRFVVRWDVKSKSVPPPFPPEAPASILLDLSGMPSVNIEQLGNKTAALTMPVPLHFQAIKDKSLAIGTKWLDVVRETSTTLLANGYKIVAFRAKATDYGEYLWTKTNEAS